jgi:hypothetical protein
MMSANQKIALILIGSFLIVWCFSSYLDRWLLSGISASLLASLISSAILVFGIDQILKQDQARREALIKQQIKQSAAWVVGSIIYELTYLIGRMAKASAAANWRVPRDFSELYTKDTIDQICHHLNLDANAGVYPPSNWRIYISQIIAHFRSEINRAIEQFGSYIPAPLVTDLIKLRNGPLFYYLGAIANLKEHYSRAPVIGKGVEELLLKDFNLILRIINQLKEWQESINVSPISFQWIYQDLTQHDVAPRQGDSRIEPSEEEFRRIFVEYI